MSEIVITTLLGLEKPIDIFYTFFTGSFAVFLGAGCTGVIFGSAFAIGKVITNKFITTRNNNTII